MKTKNTSISKKNINETVVLEGWVSKIRDLGNLIFIDLRDRSGIIQLKINNKSKAFALAATLKNEYVIKASGVVILRDKANPNLETGEIEVDIDDIEILNKSKDLPFDLNNITALEDTRLKYRYLDLRRENLKNNLIIKHKIMQAARNYLNNNDFIEMETPILCKSTPEGARDYLVPSRINKGSFYALPQSPQIFKQLLMASGFEKYYQLARCFRDEDLRADRQPEFTQIDLEMSFVDENDVISLTEGMLSNIFKEIKGIDIQLPIERMTYDDAIDKYGSDKPDTRFNMEINDITDAFTNTEFSVFKNVIAENGIINAIVVKNKADNFSRKDIDKLTDFVKTYKANALAFLKYNEEFTGSIAKFVDNKTSDYLIKNLHLENNDLILIIAGDKKIVKNSLGFLRLKLGKDLDLIDKNKFNFLWITDFPMFEYSEEENRYIACHHPFTQPKDINLLNDKENAKARAYDIVLNGYEIGGGSIRIHKFDMQEKVLEALGFDKKIAYKQFGFLLDALSLGTPPHGGLALGLERLTMILCETENIRDVIAFPKTASASDLMSDAPNEVSKKQLDELGLNLKNN
ncbi:MAG: aspartate--tRNA ligase [Bacilli bacterium]|nr:aspartate--tRNA ligase [Bacilli bacterium]